MVEQAGRTDFLNLPMLQRQNLSERVILILKHFILNQELQIDDRLPPERQLAMAEECAQEALVQVWRKLDSYRGDGPFLGWVTRIAVNKLRDRLRHERPWQAKTEITENLQPTSSDPISDVLALLMQALQQLTPCERHVLTGRLLQERSSEEIATALGISRGNERIIYLRARQKVKTVLLANGYAPAARRAGPAVKSAPSGDGPLLKK